MTLLVELDPIGPDGLPTSTTVWCPCCEAIYRVPFEKRNSWRCPCRLRALPLPSETPSYLQSNIPVPCICQPVRVNAETGRPITRAELVAAELEALMQGLRRKS